MGLTSDEIKDQTYFLAYTPFERLSKTLFPIGINKFREYRYYVGTIADFPEGAKDKRAKLLGEQIIKEKLAEKYKSNTFTL